MITHLHLWIFTELLCLKLKPKIIIVITLKITVFYENVNKRFHHCKMKA